MDDAPTIPPQHQDRMPAYEHPMTPQPDCMPRHPGTGKLDGRVALVTGGDSGIGRAVAVLFAREGASVGIAYLDEHDDANETKRLVEEEGGKAVLIPGDLASKAQCDHAVQKTIEALGGLDILVSNAGIASSAPIEETSVELWTRNHDILTKGYFLVSREAFRLLRAQDMGGSVIFVASKNGLAASPNASAYCSAKAAEIHLARCLALEGAEAGIRVNVVNPDAVLRGSRIWEGEWLEQRAATYKTDKEGLEEMYRQRALLKRSVFPEDIAEAAYFFASDVSSKSTGNIINVDGGNVQSFPR